MVDFFESTSAVKILSLHLLQERCLLKRYGNNTVKPPSSNSHHTSTVPFCLSWNLGTDCGLLFTSANLRGVPSSSVTFGSWTVASLCGGHKAIQWREQLKYWNYLSSKNIEIFSAIRLVYKAVSLSLSQSESRKHLFTCWKIISSDQKSPVRSVKMNNAFARKHHTLSLKVCISSSCRFLTLKVAETTEKLVSLEKQIKKNIEE